MKHPLSLRWPLVPLLLLVAPACAYRGDTPEPRDPRIFRCKEDGLCTKTIERHSLSGGFRKGDKEIKFDILYRPTLTPDEYPYCSRFQDATGHRFFNVSAPGCPASWQHVRWDGEDDVSEEQDISERNAMVMEMAALLWDLPPEKRATGAWRDLWMTADSFNPNGEDAKDQERVIREMKEKGLPGVAPEGKRPVIELPFLPKDKRIIIDHPKPILYRETPEWVPNQIEPQERQYDARLEFKQKIELFQKPVQKYLIAGPDMPYHHSAARISLYSRPIDSPDETPFDLIARINTHNHGASARNPKMERYLVCDEFPVTRGYYAWKGECPGRWGRDHLCHDDTALQIFNAYGGYNEPAECNNAPRGFSVVCRKPW